jgi:hypothetical protein
MTNFLVHRGTTTIFFSLSRSVVVATTANPQIFYVGILLPHRRVVIILTLTMMRPWTLRLGKGARCNVLVKNLRSSREIKGRILNPQPKQRVTDLLVTRQAILTCGKLTYEAIFAVIGRCEDERVARRKGKRWWRWWRWRTGGSGSVGGGGDG